VPFLRRILIKSSYSLKLGSETARGSETPWYSNIEEQDLIPNFWGIKESVIKLMRTKGFNKLRRLALTRCNSLWTLIWLMFTSTYNHIIFHGYIQGPRCRKGGKYGRREGICKARTRKTLKLRPTELFSNVSLRRHLAKFGLSERSPSFSTNSSAYLKFLGCARWPGSSCTILQSCGAHNLPRRLIVSLPTSLRLYCEYTARCNFHTSR
jgi:hypothetical protein